MSEKLCYVKGSFAYFTTQELSKQWGDDWNDAPYEHNAGEPYEPCWHNEPTRRNDPEARRGLKPGTQTHLEVGELCRCVSCQRDWNEDGTPAWSITKVAFDGPLDQPCEGVLNSRYSVEQINSGAVAWLVTSQWSSGPTVAVPAGVSIARFCELVRQAGGTVYLPAKGGDA